MTINDGAAGKADSEIAVQFLLPAPELRRFISGYHFYTLSYPAGHVHHDLFYPAWANVRFYASDTSWRITIGNRVFDPVPRAALFGPTSRVSASASGAGILIGAGLTPLGWSRFVRAEAADHADRIMALGEVMPNSDGVAAAVLGAGDAGTAAAAMDDFFLQRMGGPGRADGRIEAMHRLLAEAPPISVNDAAAELGLHPRAFLRLALAAFGFRPKLLLRRARFLRTLTRLEEEPEATWVDVLDVGYHDQSHFIRDSHEFLGMAPGDFLRLPRPINAASTRLRRAMLGAPAQALHRPT
ncbi:MAG TPA: helix-turn-helix domain-containing protein [Sphingomonas sp.]